MYRTRPREGRRPYVRAMTPWPSAWPDGWPAAPGGADMVLAQRVEQRRAEDAGGAAGVAEAEHEGRQHEVPEVGRLAAAGDREPAEMEAEDQDADDREIEGGRRDADERDRARQRVDP